MVHFNWLQLLPGVGHDYVHIATFAIACGLLCLLGLVGRLVLVSRGENFYVPEGRLNIKGFFEVVLEFVVGLSEMIMGEHGRKFAPMFATVFLVILVNNLMGLIPGMTPATENLNTTLAIGLFSFVVYNIYGIKEHGIHYVKQFWGPLFWLGPLMFCLELISHLIRPFSLGLRLKSNMQGDHIVLGVFMELVPYVVPALFYLLGMFVSFMQAFVFTLMSMIYVSMAVSHDH